MRLKWKCHIILPSFNGVGTMMTDKQFIGKHKQMMAIGKELDAEAKRRYVGLTIAVRVYVSIKKKVKE
jgi:hypothetical protein